MLTRRNWKLSVTACLVAMALVVVPAIAAELIGTVKSVDPDAKKIVVTQKDTDKDYEISVNDDTVFLKNNGEKYEKYDLAKLKKGRGLTVTHDKNVASKIVLEKGKGKAKAAPR
jgi:hypothetical protein